MKISLCITVFNEEKSIKRLLTSIERQTKLPDEIVIVDGGSIDKTIDFLNKHKSYIKQVKIIVKKGNRAIGRNEAIRLATGNIIAITDAGCELDSHWLEEITNPFDSKKIQVVSGYYKGKSKNSLEASLVPYVLVMRDKVNSKNFLPSTRSMAMRKNLWKQLGGFPIQYTWNEDFVFSKQIEKVGIIPIFAENAIVFWFPRETIWQGWNMFYAFAKGDAQADIWRPKVIILLLRMIFVSFFFIYAVLMQNILVWQILGGGAIFYGLWAISKNYCYVKTPMAFIYLPLWQVISDNAVFVGTFVGFFWKKIKQK
ncbi:sugar transferase related protein [Candidatus Levyibacteriota bacterium]|nr:glycosyltransferase [Candidatus Levybacteria bacterium]MSU25867.1 glycosyltransferase [Candidatus Levybacteria bacterium]GDX61909.1 sugar transferase related protein [Candidatus Levybacteria bacterium]